MLWVLLSLIACAPLEAPADPCSWVPTDTPVDAELVAAALPNGVRSLQLSARFVTGEAARLDGTLLTLGEAYEVAPEGSCTRDTPEIAVPVVLTAVEQRAGLQLDGLGELRLSGSDDAALSLRVVLPTPLDTTRQSAASQVQIPTSPKGIAVLDIEAASFALQTCTRATSGTRCTPLIVPE